MKKLVSLLLVCIMLFALLPQLTPTAEAATSGSCGKNLKWSINTDTAVLTISGSGAMTDYAYFDKAENDTRPWKDYAKNIAKVVIKEGVTTIGTYAFQDCWKLKTLSLPKSLKQIKKGAFYACFRLPSFTVPTGVTVIEPEVFKYCYDLNSVKLHGSVREIQEKAFYDCDSLQKISFPASVTTIGPYAFASSGLVKVTIPATITSIGDYAFEFCRNMTSITFPEKSPTLGEGICSSCYVLTSVTLPTNLKVLPQYMFSTCSSLAEIKLPDSLTTIDSYAFSYCDSLETITFPKKLTTIGQGAFSDCDRLWKLSFPASVKTIKPFAFRGCGWLLTLKLPKTVESIGYNVCYGCGNLKGVVVANTALDTSDIKYNGESFSSAKTTTIYGYTGSTIQEYAAKWDYKFENLKKHTHKYTTITLEPDCLHVGHKVKFCACGEVAKDTVLPAAGHFYKNGKCVRCGADRPNTFKDVKSNAFYADAVAWAVERDITKGTSATTFGPEEKCTRAQVVTFLWRAKGSPEPKSTKNPFKDVKAKDYYYKAVLWAVENGITTGVSKTSFGPNQACTRGQVVTFIWRAQREPKAALDKNPFKDVSKKSFCYNAVIWAVRYGVTSGLTKTTFGPNQTCTRGQVVTFLCRALGK